MMCSLEDIQITTTNIFLGFVFFSSSIASPVINCGSGWTYGNHLSGKGCLRKLSSDFSQRTCLLNGYHITLTQVPWGEVRRRDKFCVRDEHLTYEEVTTESPAMIDGINTDDLKFDVKGEIEDSKHGLAKAMGCCLDGVQPSG
ncbi:uncharacterized protein LOC134704887 [Mytilus trossulus]|uniref:uncharacterized protein LOC134704887 n=1 Tax=Mytilus trossulus TaxID=6551 RepID=UPI0030060BC0